jgi:hypothetical protein
MAVTASLHSLIELLEQRLLLIGELHGRLDLNAAKQVTDTRSPH